MALMAGGAGVGRKVLGVGLFECFIDCCVAFVLVAGAAVLLGGILCVLDDHGVMWPSVAGHADLRLNSQQMEGLTAFLAVTAEAARDIAMLGVAVSTGQSGVLAGEIFQFFGRTTVAVGAEVRLDCRKFQGCVGIGVAVAALLGLLLGSMGETVAICAFGKGISILDLARCVGMVHFVTEGALFLVAIARGLQLVEHGDVTLGALLHRQGLYGLIEKCWAGRNLFDLLCEVNLSGSGLSRGTQGDHGPN